ncbi:transposase [Streptomyces sp. NPDC047461]|uniref:RNA-guided endonuclease InsQ/TnpB family protein n=1 Tax=Streptomyces sp. NPDC047461 TaxID=3155619 RepID=UPI003406E157
MTRQVKRAFKYRFYPTGGQAAELSRTFGCVRLVYNKALEDRTRAWYGEQRRISYVQSSAALTQWKKTGELAFLAEVSSVPLQQALRHLQTAFGNFFAQRAKYPRYKSRKKSRSSAEYTRSAFTWRDGQLTLAKMADPLDIRWSRPLPDGAQPTTVTVSRDRAGRWFVSLLCQDTIASAPATTNAVGLDAGITSLVTLSTGEKIANPRHERRDRARLAKVQRELSRKAKGSANREKARRTVARVHARIADRRRDVLHKLSTRLVRENCENQRVLSRAVAWPATSPPPPPSAPSPSPLATITRWTTSPRPTTASTPAAATAESCSPSPNSAVSGHCPAQLPSCTGRTVALPSNRTSSRRRGWPSIRLSWGGCRAGRRCRPGGPSARPQRSAGPEGGLDERGWWYPSGAPPYKIGRTRPKVTG